MPIQDGLIEPRCGQWDQNRVDFCRNSRNIVPSFKDSSIENHLDNDLNWEGSTGTLRDAQLTSEQTFMYSVECGGGPR